MSTGAARRAPTAQPHRLHADGDDRIELYDQFQNAPCGLLSTTEDGVLTRVNDTFLRWTGYTRSEIVGRSFADLLSGSSRRTYETGFLPVIRLGGEVREAALVLQCNGQRTLPVLANSTVRPATGGSAGGTRIAVFDATGRKDYEQEMISARRAAERSEARVRVLQRASTAFGDASTVDALAGMLARTVRTAFDAAACAVMMPDRESGRIRTVGGSNPLGSSAAIDSDRPEADVLRSGAAVSVGSIAAADLQSPSLGPALQANGLGAVHVIALSPHRDHVGVLACFFGGDRHLDDHEQELARALAGQANQALQRILLQQQLRFQAMHDQLTGLANRQLLQYRLIQAVNRAHRQGQPMAVIFMDLDGFKPINDALGHLLGDAVLEQVSARLTASVRAQDTAARFGGDEFVVLCEDTDAAAATVLAARIRAEVRRPLTGPAADFTVTASVGIAVYRPDGRPRPEPKHLLVQADTAMYRSKAAGRDRDTVVDV
ncbi:diguanylate cyclase domain-containing protein [Nakamurella sp. GG22]